MANYPGSLPTKDPAGSDLGSNPHSTLHDNKWDEIVAIATELGTQPSGPDSDVVSRLARIDGENSRTGVELRRVTGQTIPAGTWTAIAWDTADQDTDGFITTPATTMTVPAGQTGVYLMTFRDTGTTGASTEFRIVAGARTYEHSVPNSATITVAAFTVCAFLNAGEAVAGSIYWPAGGSWTGSFEMWRVSI